MGDDDIRALAADAFARFNDADDHDAFFHAYDPNVVLHGYPAGLQGHDGLRAFHEALWKAFPDVRLTVEDLVVETDRAALRYRLQGTHRGPYLGVAPTGLRFDVEGLTLLRVADGRVMEEWHSPTELAILRQLGAVQANVPHAGRERGEPPRRSASAEAAALRLDEREAERR
jgi:predicted ester cyclase